MKNLYRIFTIILVLLLITLLFLQYNSHSYHSIKLVEAIENRDFELIEEIVTDDYMALNTFPSIMPDIWNSIMGIPIEYPLTVACIMGDSEMVKFLLDKGACPNIIGHTGKTPLIKSLEVNNKNRFEIAMILIEYGAQIDYIVPNSKLDSVMLNSVSIFTSDNSTTIEEGQGFFDYLWERADLKRTNMTYLLCNCAYYNNVYAGTKVLSNTDTEINSTNGLKETPLIKASKNNSYEFAVMLLERGANKDLTDENGKTARDYAEEYGYTELIQLLSE
jgi:ankyrin repeat protein